MKTKSNESIAMRVSVNSIIGNVLLSAFKLFAGIFANSYAMISDAIHSASDVFSTFIVMIGIKVAGKDSDDKHPYGHERLECVAAIILAIILAITGFGIGYSGVVKIIEGNYESIVMPGTLALVAAVVSIVVKEAMYWYTRNAAIKINSGALHADAWHHRSDAFSSVGSFVGILGSQLGAPICDSIASVVICLFIVKAAYTIFIDAIRKMTDESCDLEEETNMKESILTVESVEGIASLKTRKFGNRIYMEVDLLIDGSFSLEQSHKIGDKVHDLIEKNFLDVKHCMVHISPTVHNETNFTDK